MLQTVIFKLLIKESSKWLLYIINNSTIGVVCKIVQNFFVVNNLTHMIHKYYNNIKLKKYDSYAIMSLKCYFLGVLITTLNSNINRKVFLVNSRDCLVLKLI